MTSRRVWRLLRGMVSASCLALASFAAELPTSAGTGIRFEGIMVAEGVVRYFLDIPAGGAKWLAVGDTLEEVTVLGYDAKTGELLVTRRGRPGRISLGGSVIDAAIPPAELVQSRKPGRRLTPNADAVLSRQFPGKTFGEDTYQPLEDLMDPPPPLDGMPPEVMDAYGGPDGPGKAEKVLQEVNARRIQRRVEAQLK